MNTAESKHKQQFLASAGGFGLSALKLCGLLFLGLIKLMFLALANGHQRADQEDLDDDGPLACPPDENYIRHEDGFWHKS